MAAQKCHKKSAFPSRLSFNNSAPHFNSDPLGICIFSAEDYESSYPPPTYIHTLFS